MTWQRKTRITVETERVIFIKRRQMKVEACCPICADQPRLVSAEEAAATTALSRRAIYRLVESGQLHFAETSDGRLLICLSSLQQRQSAWRRA